MGLVKLLREYRRPPEHEALWDKLQQIRDLATYSPDLVASKEGTPFHNFIQESAVMTPITKEQYMPELESATNLEKRKYNKGIIIGAGGVAAAFLGYFFDPSVHQTGGIPEHLLMLTGLTHAIRSWSLKLDTQYVINLARNMDNPSHPYAKFIGNHLRDIRSL